MIPFPCESSNETTDPSKADDCGSSMGVERIFSGIPFNTGFSEASNAAVQSRNSENSNCLVEPLARNIDFSTTPKIYCRNSGLEQRSRWSRHPGSPETNRLPAQCSKPRGGRSSGSSAWNGHMLSVSMLRVRISTGRIISTRANWLRFLIPPMPNHLTVPGMNLMRKLVTDQCQNWNP